MSESKKDKLPLGHREEIRDASLDDVHKRMQIAFEQCSTITAEELAFAVVIVGKNEPDPDSTEPGATRTVATALIGGPPIEWLNTIYFLTEQIKVMAPQLLPLIGANAADQMVKFAKDKILSQKYDNTGGSDIKDTIDQLLAQFQNLQPPDKGVH